MMGVKPMRNVTTSNPHILHTMGLVILSDDCVNDSRIVDLNTQPKSG